MSDDILIRAENVSKKFCRSLKKSLWYGVTDIVSELNPFRQRNPESGELPLRDHEFLAVNNVSFALHRGECLGLIGRNGAGKTTLLKVLNGLIKPDAGRIEMRGRIAALIALGAGFNPILTGRENIYINASILGLAKREIDKKLDEIIDFSEIREFIDAPVQSYSSGMQVRLGFAVASTLNPDILLLDEVLAVGDLAFRLKCYRRIDTLRDRSVVIFVSHSVEQIGRICSSVLLMQKGACVHYGEVSRGLELYESEPGQEKIEVATHCSAPILRASATLAETAIEFGEAVSLDLEIEVQEAIAVNVRVAFLQYPSQSVAGTAESSAQIHQPMTLNKGPGKFRITVDHAYLRAGSYIAALMIFEAGSRSLLFLQRGDMIFTIRHSFYSETPHLMPLRISFT